MSNDTFRRDLSNSTAIGVMNIPVLVEKFEFGIQYHGGAILPPIIVNTAWAQVVVVLVIYIHPRSKCLRTFQIDPVRELLYVKGHVPGQNGGYIRVTDAVR